CLVGAAPGDGAPTGADVLDRLIARATAALCAEMLGGMQEAFDRTIAYLEERKQFGVPIGSFQALKHRAAHLFCELELTRSVVRAALVAVDAGAADAAILVAAAKAKASATYVDVTAEAIQLHGGIGATDDLDIGLFYKRARACELTFGDAAYHRDRFGQLQGY
ncbi:MAG: acyl-CoA dehydrogenase, partial [Myxococcales bacterium]|nr:acyl-CoA dehydrogenase [Myxococcales bacterium]